MVTSTRVPTVSMANRAAFAVAMVKAVEEEGEDLH
jgi:hypothetical protein